MATKSKKVVIKGKKGQKPLTFNKGALHRALGVPEDEPIPASKKAAALAGRYGPKAKKQAQFGFKGALAKGRKTAAKKKKRKAAKKTE